MSIIRVQKNDNYVVMNRTALNDNRLSWKAKGIMAYMLSMPNDWNFYLEELQNHATDGKDSLRSGFNELKKYGYVKRYPVKDPETKRIISWETVVLEIPEEPHTDIPQMEKPHVEYPEVEKPFMENPPLLSTDNNQVLNIPSIDNNQILTDKDVGKRLDENLDKPSSVNPLIHPSFQPIKEAFEQVVRTATVQDCNYINEALEFYEPALILAAIDTGKDSARTFKYILSILDNWRIEYKVKTYADWAQKIQQRGDQHGSNKQHNISTTDDAEARLQRKTEQLKKLL